MINRKKAGFANAFDASAFCQAYKDWDGNPMNVFLQMDVDEFFNMLFDKIETLLKDTEHVRSFLSF
jgi:ubiquitin carboxyl-terminal hydrolase 9/24